ncbi:MAG TPA: hypothetical protein VMW70_14855 [Burkholderiales bacterium]|nr:hypothetical protein [Burkholderiales bacterium]
MNTLVMMFLFVTSQADLNCGQVAAPSARTHQLVAAGPAITAGHATPTARLVAASLPSVSSPGVVSATADADFLYYVDLHSQALSENSGPSMNPWIELHPLGSTEGTPDFDQHAPDVAQRSGERSGLSGQMPRRANGHACS